MLRRSFIHLKGVGPSSERRLWARGLSGWEDVAAGALGEARRQEARVFERAYDEGRWSFFDRHWPSAERWRAFGDLRDRTAYVDIETDGGFGPESITVIGVHDGRAPRFFVEGRDLEQAVDYLESFSCVVTYNGARFDMPLIRARFRYNAFNHVHIDLCPALRRLGFRGGLKGIEPQFGLERSKATRGLDGWDAVRLWNRARAGDAHALDTLLAYNAEDVVHLEPLMEAAYRLLSERAGAPWFE